MNYKINSEPLYQALIPKGQLAIKFDIPKYADEYMLHLSKDNSNMQRLNQKQIQFFTMTFRCCCICNACRYGVPKNLNDQFQIFSLTFSSAFIDFLNTILQKNISYLDRYCSKISPMLQNENESDSKTLEDALRSFNQIKSYNIITTEHIEKVSKEIESYIQLPLLSPIINQIDEQISQIIKIIKDILSKHDHNISTKINTIISTIKQKSEELRICSTECTQKLKSLFDPFSVKAYGKIMIFLNKFISSLNDFVFMAIKIAFFSDFEQADSTNFFSILYRIAINSIYIMTDVHKLAHYRTNYTLSVVSIKLNFSFIFKNLTNIHKEIHNFLKFTPTLFQATTILEFTKITQKLFDADNEFLNQMNEYFIKIKSAKKSIVFKPIDVHQLTEKKDESIQFFTSFQKCAYIIAFSLIKNNYEAYQLAGMTVLLQNSYKKLINYLSSQIVNENLSAEEKKAYSLTFHSIQYSMSFFVNEFSEFGENPNDKFLRSKCSIVALNLVFEIYTCNSNIDMTDMMEKSLEMFLIFIGENNSMISSFYLIYRRAIQLSIFHSAFLMTNYSKLLIKQLKLGADAPIANLNVAKKLNKMLLHKLTSYRQYEIFDRAFTFPNSLYEIINELKNFVDNLVFCSDDYKSILLESIKNFKNFYKLVNASMERASIGSWDYDINFFNDYIKNQLIEIQNYRNLISNSNNDDDKDIDTDGTTKYVKNHSVISNSSFVLSKCIFEICCLARQISNVPLSTIEEIRSDVIEFLEKGIELSIITVDDKSEQIISENHNNINKLLDRIEEKLSKEILPITLEITKSNDKENDEKEIKFSPRDIFVFTNYDTLWKSKKNGQGTPDTTNYIKKMKAFYQNLDKFQKSFHSPHKSKIKSNLSAEEQDNENNNNGFMLTSTVDPSSNNMNSPILQPRNKANINKSQRPSSIKVQTDQKTYVKSDHNSIPINSNSDKLLINEDDDSKSRVPFESSSSGSQKIKNRSLTVNQQQQKDAIINDDEIPKRKVSDFDENKLSSNGKRLSISKIQSISEIIKPPSLPEFNKWKIDASKISSIDDQDNNENQDDEKSEEGPIGLFSTLKVFDSKAVLKEALAERKSINDFSYNVDDSDSD